MDYQILQKLVMGRATLTDQRHAPIFERILNRLNELITVGWLPARNIADMVKWVPRELNKAADLMANLAMDRGEDVKMGPETLYQVSEGGHV